MKKLIALVFLIAAASLPIHAQGVLSPVARFQFANNNGQNCNACKLYTYAAGTSTPLVTYNNVDLDASHENQNPIVMNSSGRPSYMSAEIPIYLSAASYKFILKTSQDVTIWTQDNVTSWNILSLSFATKLDDKVCHASQYSGANAAAKINACVAVLPSTGGTIITDGLEGAQSGTTSITLSKPIKLEIGAMTLTSSSAVSIISVSSAGASVECLNPTASILVSSSTSSDGVLVGAADFTMRNCTVRGAGGSSHTAGSSGVDSGARANITLLNNIIEEWPGHGVNTGSGSTNWKLTNNIVRNNYDDGFLSPYGDSGHVLTSNYFYGNGSSGIDINSSRNRVVGNYTYSNGDKYVGTGLECSGIFVDAIGGNANNNEFIGNHAYLNSCEGVRLRGGDNVARTANSNKFVGNDFIDNGTIGFYLDTSVGASCGTVNFTIVQGNTITGNGSHGFLQGGGSTCTVTLTDVSNNQINSNTGTGLYVAYGNDLQARHNELYSNGTAYDTTGSTRTTLIGNKTQVTDSGYYIPANRVGIGMASGAYGTLDLRTGTAGTDGLFLGDATNGWLLTETSDAALAVRVTSSGTPSTDSRLILYNTNGVIAVTPNSYATISALTLPNGAFGVMTDGALTSGANNTCTSGGSGAFFVKVNGTLRCFINQN